MAFWVYLLRCADGSFYVGHSDDLDRRLGQHQTGEFEGYTSTRLPVRLEYSEELASRDEALAAERQIKGWSRKKKEALCKGDWNELSRLARRRKPFERSAKRPFETAARKRPPQGER
jgi:predicted GIY-YIG superfamily endonuclease